MVLEKSSGIACYYFMELHSSLTNYLFVQIVNFKWHKNLGAVQLRKDAFEIIEGMKNIDCCCLFLL